MTDTAGAALALKLLAERLKEASAGGLRRDVQASLTEAAKPLVKEISSLKHLKPYLPDRYAAVLHDDLTVTGKRIFTADPHVQIQAKAAREKRRKVRLLDAGFINHPIWPRGERSTWNWQNRQTGGMKPGFFSDPCKKAAPDIREKVLEAMAETSRKITGG